MTENSNYFFEVFMCLVILNLMRNARSRVVIDDRNIIFPEVDHAGLFKLMFNFSLENNKFPSCLSNSL